MKLQVLGMAFVLAMGICGCGQKEKGTEPSGTEAVATVESANQGDTNLSAETNTIEEVKEPITLAAGLMRIL